MTANDMRRVPVAHCQSAKLPEQSTSPQSLWTFGMKSPETICRQHAHGEFEFSRHAFKRAVDRNISELEIRQAGARTQIIEDYPDDKYSPSCLLLGFTLQGRPSTCRSRISSLPW
jgi:hypothetical protein